MPVLYTASFYDPQDWMGRLYRVSRAHPRGRKTQWETLPFLYPSRDLLQAYRAGDIGFPDFKREYLAGLEAAIGRASELQEWLATCSFPGPVYVTVLRAGGAGLPPTSTGPVASREGGLRGAWRAALEVWPGKPLAGFRAAPSRRIPVLCGIIVYVIRFNNQLLLR